MAEVITNPYDPSNPFDFNNQGGDGGFYDGGANMPWNPFANSNYGNPFTGVDPSNPYDTFPSGTYVGDGSNPFTGGLGGNPFGTVNFGGTGVGPYAGPTGTTQPGGFNPPAGWEVDKVDLGPWSQGGGEIWSKPLPPPSQFPNIQFGIPDFNIGTGGLIIGGGILGSGIFGGGGGGGGGMRGGGPDVESGTGTQGPIVPPITDGGGTQNPPLTKDDISGPSKDVLFPPAVWDGSMDQESKNRWDPRIPFPGTSQPPSGEGTKPADIIVPPIIPGAPPGSPNENTTPTTIYKPLGPVMPTPPAGGGGGSGGGTNPPTNTPPTTPNIPMDPSKRNYLGEGQLGVDAMRELMPQLLDQYDLWSGRPGKADRTNFYNSLQGEYGMSSWNPELTKQANLQTQKSNTALRTSNLEDIELLGKRAFNAQRAANPELYGMLGAYSGGAQQQLANDYAAVGRGGQLTADEIRMAQQSAREAAGAQGRLRGSGTQAAEVLNRFQYQQQRDQQNRANLGQSQQAALGGMNASAQAAFNPFSTLLGQGMNTQNVGTNQTLFNQGTGFSSGALSNQYTQQLTNPFNPYAADVYGSNFNAENAMKIANSNNSAYSDAARNKLLLDGLGKIFNIGAGQGWWGAPAGSTGTKGP
jgi:hypothetical protein